MSGETTTTAGFQFNLSIPEAVTLSKLNQLGQPGIRVNAGAINTRELADNAVNSDKLSDDIVSQLNAAAVIGNGAVNTQQIANGAVTIDKLEDNLNQIMRPFITPGTIYIPAAGTIADILTTFKGWVLADGSAYNTTLGTGTVLDLRNRFVICANEDNGGNAVTTVNGPATYEISGGSPTHNISGSTEGHLLEGSECGLKAHNHINGSFDTLLLVDGTGTVDNPNNSPGEPKLTAGGNGPILPAGPEDADDEHDHVISINGVNHMNPFFAMAYITYVGVA